MAERYSLCTISSLDDPDSRGFVIDAMDGAVSLFIVRRGESVMAYRNSCPHTGINLEWQPHQFLDPSGSYIQCATHGALFRIEDGYCLRGPCAGDALQPIEVQIEEGQLVAILQQ
ncbi:MAG: Rieske 2Fe-2S domain-containing protein [Candidatus Thiodiazotropha sp.]